MGNRQRINESLINDLVSFLTSSLSDLTISSSDNVSVDKPTMSDDEMYKKILQGIGAPVTDENMKFFYGWRQAEGAKASFNPFNTTKKKEKASFYNCLKRKDGVCVGGVRNYKSQQEGIDATVETLKLSYYNCITNGLRNNIGAKKIAKSCRSELKTWGTGDLVAKVLDGKSVSPPDIATSPGKTVT